MSKNRMTSWERRQRRRIRIMVTVVLLILVLVGVFLAFRLSLSYDQWDLTQFYNVTYSGYNNNGAVVLTKNAQAIDSAFADAKKEYRQHVLHIQSIEDEDYEAFRDSLQANVLSNGPFSNGSKVTIEIEYDRELAKKLNVEIINARMNVTVSGLPTVSVLTKEDLFGNLKVSFDGISPEITLTIINDSPIPYVKNMEFVPVSQKQYFANGETVTIQAVFDEADALANHYVVDVPKEECTMDYVATASESYVTNPDQLSDELLNTAVANGLLAFTDANEYGVRIYCEANLVPVYVNKMATFKWVSQTPRSVYFKSVKENSVALNGNYANELDVVYDALMTQANGVSCTCYAVVRYTNLLMKSDGTVEIDLTNPKIVSADYKLDSIHKAVVTMRESDFNITKLR